MSQVLLQDNFVSLCVDGSQNVFAGKCRVLVEGQMMAVGTAIPDVLRPVTSVRGIDALFGEGSVLSESLKKLFCQCPANLEVFVIPRSDTFAGLFARYELTVTGTATSPGRIELFLLDRDYSIDIAVSTGDTPTVIAAAIDAAIPANFPYFASVTAGVITLSAKNKGTIGNTLNPVFNWRGKADYAPAGVSIATVQTTVGTAAPLPLDYKAILGECCYSCFAVLSDDVAIQNTWIAYLRGSLGLRNAAVFRSCLHASDWHPRRDFGQDCQR
jgi:phage tail sheath gpL-like